ncbi:sensor histidine kinase [Microbispora sp. ATCC PTA-5024]|uniref:sensor histidine kinase n=1 Tax=Microbispora sp. ATCC PTA-5024 TaxID=316330 RepID=UPI0012EDA6D8|nr:HAMP domain-containing sensor histidine kinase [Microbispora sp. ATCC PTA-5024]
MSRDDRARERVRRRGVGRRRAFPGRHLTGGAVAGGAGEAAETGAETSPRTGRGTGRAFAVRLVLAACVPAMQALVGYAIGGTVRERRTRQEMAAISRHLAATAEGQLPTPVPPGPLGPDTARLVESINATIELCRRLGWFASDLSHEIRSPLTALRAELEEAALHHEDTDVRQLVERALPSIDRAEAVVASMLMLARLQACTDRERVRVDLADLVKSEIDGRERLHPVTIRVADRVVVRAVPEQVRQAMTNLLDNAERHARAHVEVEVARRGRTALLVVDDDGEGVPEADRQRIFDRFIRLEDSRRRDGMGAGLGLGITRAIAEAHHGDVRAEDRPGGGARFVLRLPAAS